MSEDFVRRLPDAGFSFNIRDKGGSVFHLDIQMILLIIAIVSYGLLILYSAVDQSNDPVVAQSMKIALAFVAMIIMAQISPIFYLRLAPWLFLIGVILLLLVMWLRIEGVVSFQPSEIMKLVLPMILAWYFHDRHLPPRLIHLFWAAVMIIIPVVLIASQPDLGTAVIICASGLLVLFLAGVSWRYVMIVLGLGIVSAPALWFVLRDYQQQRILTFLDPERDPLGAGWNIIQSKTAIGSGGLSGKGLFQGTQSHLDFLPESQTDFIIAVLAEELGLVGVMLLLILYILLVGRGIIISIQAQDTFGRLLAGSITFTFFVYVFVNLGMVSGMLPIVGVPLPLVSYGGTSILTLFAGFGIIMSIHTHRRISGVA